MPAGVTADRSRLLDCMHKAREAEETLAFIRKSLAGVCDAQDPAGSSSDLLSSRSRSRYNTVPTGIAKAVASELRIDTDLKASGAEATDVSLSDASPSSPSRPRPGALARSWTKQEKGQPPYIVDQIVIDSINEAAGDKEATPMASTKNTLTRMLTTSLISATLGKTTEADAKANKAQSSAAVYTGQDFVVQKTCWGWTRVPVMHPEAKHRLFWLMAGFIFIVAEAYLIPYYICFGVSAEGFFLVFVNLANTYFILDVPFTFISGFMDPDGMLVMSPNRIAQRYMRTWLIPDLAAGIPWEWVAVDPDQASVTKSIRFVRAFRLLRLTRLVRLMKLKSFMEKVEIFIESNQSIVFAVGVFRVLSLLFAFTHWAACAWYVLGAREDGNYPSTWLEWKAADYAKSMESVHQKYTYALYFSLTTMTTVGYGDITPQNYDEVCFCLVLLGIASVVFAMLMGVLTDLIATLNNQSHVRAEKKMLLSRYMHWRAVPRKLWMSIRQHLIFLWDTNEGYDAYEDEMKDLLPPVLKTELCYHIYGRILTSAPFFMWMKNYTICCKQLSSMVQSVFLSKGDHIFRLGQDNTQIYVLLTGNVRLSRNENLHNEEDFGSGPRAGGNPEDPQAPNDGDGSKGFQIPRHRETNAMDLGAAVAASAKSLLAHKGEQAKTAHVVKTLWSNAHTDGVRPSMFSSASPAEPVKAVDSGGKDGKDIRRKNSPDCPDGPHGLFDSEVMKDAESKLKNKDSAEQRAAKLMQEVWRRKAAKRKARMEADNSMPLRDKFHSVHSAPNSQSKAKHRSIDQMPSRVVEAPAYFGESCLWVPYEDWDVCAPPKYMYTTTCESRSELVYVPRSAVKEIIVRYSPWLQERFEYFRENVVQGLEGLVHAHAKLDASFHCPLPDAVDWASVETAMTFPEDGVSLQAMHHQVLIRAAESSARGTPHPLRGPCNDGPAMPRTYGQVPNGKSIGSARAFVRQGSRLSSGRARDNAL